MPIKGHFARSHPILRNLPKKVARLPSSVCLLLGLDQRLTGVLPARVIDDLLA